MYGRNFYEVPGQWEWTITYFQEFLIALHWGEFQDAEEFHWSALNPP